MASSTQPEDNAYPVYDRQRGLNYWTSRRVSYVDVSLENVTCCHRATFCNPVLREIIVTDTLISCYGKKITWERLFYWVTIAALLVSAWFLLYIILGDKMLPGGNLFGLCMLVVCSYILGWTLASLPFLNLPPVFGMLLAGIIIRNTNFYIITEELGRGPTAMIRIISMTFIVVRAGLQLTTAPLKKYPFFVLRLGIIAGTVELISVSLCCRYILLYPWNWAFLAGTIVACLSPAVMVHNILELASRGYGEDKGMTSILCAASSIDNIHIVSLFSIGLKVVFDMTGGPIEKRDSWAYVSKGLVDLALGFFVGITIGLFLVFFPHRNHKHAMIYRIILLAFGSLMCTTAASQMTITGAGYLATILLSFTAITGWQLLTVDFDVDRLRRVIFYIWYLCQPVMAGLIGADIDLSHWTAIRFGLHLLCIFIGVMVRSVAVILSTMGTEFSWKERVFVAIAWMPRGTIQAALAPMTVEQAEKQNDDSMIELAFDVVRLSAVAIIFLTPIPAIAIAKCGPKLLNKINMETGLRERRLSYKHVVGFLPAKDQTTTL